MGLEDVPKPPQPGVSLSWGLHRWDKGKWPENHQVAPVSADIQHPGTAGLKTPEAHFQLCSQEAIMDGCWGNWKLLGFPLSDWWITWLRG